MAIPNSIAPSAPASSDSPAAGDDEIRALKQFLVDIFGLPTSPTTVTAAAAAYQSDGTFRWSRRSEWKKGADIASAGAITIGLDGNYFTITGAVGITSISTAQAGTIVIFGFSGAPTLTHNATSLILQNGSNYTAAAGDVIGFVSEGSGNWREIFRVQATILGGAPANVTKAAAAAGTAATVSRSDHKHDITTAVVSDVTKAAAAEGTATSLARSDHKHDITTAVVSDVTKAAAAEGTATSLARSDHKHDISTATGSTQAFGDAAAEGTATSLARSDHKHAIPKFPYDRAVTQNDVVSTAAETTLYSFTVTGNDLSTNKMLHVVIVGDYLNNSGANRTLQIKVKYGATTLFDDITGAIGVSASRRAFIFDLYFGAQNATNAQFLGGSLTMSEIAGAATSGVGDISGLANSAANVSFSPISGTSAIDSTANQTLDITVTLSASNASLSIRRQAAFSYLI